MDVEEVASEESETITDSLSEESIVQDESATTSQMLLVTESEDTKSDNKDGQHAGVGDIVHVGTYPYDKVNDENLINTLDSLSKDDDNNVTVDGRKYKYNYGDWYEYYGITWRVLEVNGDVALLMSDMCIDARAFDTSWSTATWEKCESRKWLNTTFFEKAFNENEKNNIVASELINNRGNSTTDKLFFLSSSEITNSAYGFKGDSSRIASLSYYAYSQIKSNSYNNKDLYLLRDTKAIGMGYCSAVDRQRGSLESSVMTDLWVCIRPCMRANIANIPSSEISLPDTSQVPEDAVSLNGHHYYVFSNRGTYADAENYCKSLGGYLASITSQEENDFLYDYICSKSIESAYFGLTDRETEGTWKWVNGEDLSYTNWTSGEPNVESGDEDYAMFDSKFTTGKWCYGNFGNGTVSDETYFICEWDAEFYYNTDTLKIIDPEKGNTAKGKFTYKDEWFFGDTTKYNHDLAKMSLAAALAAFGADENGSAKNIKALMDTLGFSYDNESIQYPIPSRYTMGYAIGSKPISEDTSLILVASRGGGYKSEWCSNFTVGKTGDHQGFDEGSVKVGDGLYAYINKHKSDLKENVKIWMVGYSRGAAVTNLAAADLDDGFIPGFGKDNVFAYCFECPQGTINKNAHSSNYSNIHNIINKIDGVTLVAMKGWDFQRYGQDYYLPFAESLRGYSSYKAEMKKEYDKILKDNGIDDFTTRTNWVQSLTSEAKGQAITLRDLTDYITYLIDRKTYVDSSLQRDAQALADKYLGDGIQSDEILDKELGVFLTKLNFMTRFPAMADRIDYVRLTVPSPVSNIDDLPTNFMAAHYPELCLAWMNSLDGGLETYNNQYEKIFINCPVDVVIKDDEGNIVTRIIDNKVENIENGLYAYIDDNEQKVVVVPGDGNYTAEIIANDDCDVTYTVKEYSDNDYMPESIKSYQSVEMLKEGSLKADIKPEISEYILQDDNSILIPSIDESSNNINSYLIQTECDGNGIVEGGGIFTTGEFAKVTAKPGDDSTFEGWYIGSDLITSETEYRFAVTEDVYLTAKFKDEPSVSKTNIASAAISIEESTFIYTGTQITPVITVKDSSNNILVENKDFTITYSDNVNAGTATVTVTGKGNYTGTISKSFTIAKSAPTLKFASTSLSKKTGDAAFTNSLTKTTDGIVTFKSSNTNVAIVNNTSGLVTIKGAGTATITATASEGKNYKAGSTAYSLKVEEPKPTVAGFSDVQDPSHPYYKAIYWAAERGITKGYSDGTFGINRSCTRGEMMMFLWRYAGKPAPKSVSKSPFKDVPKTHTFYKAILWGSQKGITKGYSDGTFGINRNVSRGECMMFLWRLKGKPAPKAVAKAPFPDVPKSHVFYNAVLWGYQQKITTGFTSGKLKGKFGVNENCSRGQIVTFLYRAK